MGLLLFNSLQEGLGYAILALGVYITFRILNMPDLTVDGSFGLGNNFIPFHTIISIFGETVTYHTYGTLCYQFFGNILLFIPFGFSLCYYFKGGKKFFKVLCCIILVTVLVEVWQGAFNAMLQVNYRCVDIDDVMLNTIGGIFGFCVA